jgi:hypothetical protein
MPRSQLLAISLLAVSFLCAAQTTPEAPDWAKHLYKAPPEAVFAAAKSAIAAHYEIKSTYDKERILRFHVGTTAWSWGYTMTLSVIPQAESSLATIAIERSGGPALSWGSGKKEAGKVFGWIAAKLSAH